jgi:hypothetical protein
VAQFVVGEQGRAAVGVMDDRDLEVRAFCAGSTRQSIQVTMYRFRLGMNGSRGMPWRAPASSAKARLRSRSGAMFDKA